ncbi:MAG TPA: SRPBCC domain-containing protein [Anseongella sp.]|nr:SRPBCC domain-containing protein [Anseongella sp.]
MKELEFKISIAADRQKVWNTMLGPETYKEWAGASWPGSYYEGEWKEGGNLKFVSPEGGGTMATIVESRPHEFILARHIAVINSDGTEDRDSEVAEGWVGTTEAYTFTQSNGRTELKVTIDTYPEWEGMFREGWPGALAELKKICER